MWPFFHASFYVPVASIIAIGCVLILVGTWREMKRYLDERPVLRRRRFR